MHIRSTLIIMSLIFFTVAGLIVTGTAQEFIPFRGLANEIACFVLAIAAGGLCLWAQGVTRERARLKAEGDDLLLVFGPSGGHGFYQDIELQADAFEERQEILKELAQEGK